MRHTRQFVFIMGSVALLIALLGIITPPTYELQDVLDAVVHIRTDRGWQGSGVLIDKNTILTAKHVIEDCNGFKVTFRDGKVIDCNDSFYIDYVDVGFITLSVPIDIKSLKLSNKELIVGESVFCVGHPLGMNEGLEWTVTKGIISAVGRFWEDNWLGTKKSFQTDASAYPGNSGCPVVNEDYWIVGVVCGGWDENLTVGIPAKVIEKVYRCYLANIELKEIE